ncbi:hypothetical protein BDZ97DRAFT_1209471 [Flammula alnicola]|nr:hypothetical protein BDZ97DRAFT_1209471 [Flammula alnicola]
MEGPSASAPTPMVSDSNAASMGKKGTRERTITLESKPSSRTPTPSSYPHQIQVQPLPLLLPPELREAIDARSLGSLLGSEAALAAVAVRTGEMLIPEPTLSQLVPLAPMNCTGFCSCISTTVPPGQMLESDLHLFLPPLPNVPSENWFWAVLGLVRAGLNFQIRTVGDKRKSRR